MKPNKKLNLTDSQIKYYSENYPELFQLIINSPLDLELQKIFILKLDFMNEKQITDLKNILLQEKQKFDNLINETFKQKYLESIQKK